MPSATNTTKASRRAACRPCTTSLSIRWAAGPRSALGPERRDCITMNVAMLPLWILLCLVWLGLAVYLFWRQRTPPPADSGLSLIQQQMEALRDQLSSSLSQNTGTINQRLDNAAKLYGELRSQLGALSQANAQIQA